MLRLSARALGVSLLASACFGGGKMGTPGGGDAGASDATDNSEVGNPCLPGVVPESGFDDSEAYVEINGEGCGGGACLVYRLRGDPRSDCIERPAEACRADDPDCRQDSVQCASLDEVRDRVYCSCRCGEPDGCGCPDGLSCVPALSNGAAEVSYCVRNGTFSR